MSPSAPSSQPSSPPAGRLARRARLGAGLALAAVWLGVTLSHLLASGPTDSAAACRHAIYRDPVTGREQGIGSARVGSAGSMTCDGVTYRADSR